MFSNNFLISIYPLLSEMIFIERYNHLKREKDALNIEKSRICLIKGKKYSDSSNPGILWTKGLRASLIQLNILLQGVERLVVLSPNGVHISLLVLSELKVWGRLCFIYHCRPSALVIVGFRFWSCEHCPLTTHCTVTIGKKKYDKKLF